MKNVGISIFMPYAHVLF